MKFFADTADLNEIDYCFSRGVSDGITTNPKILESTGDLSNGLEFALKSLLNKYPNVPVSLETDLQGINPRNLDKINPVEIRDILLEQAYSLANLGENVVVKIPICQGGLLATEELSKKGIRTNVTACMTPYQAISAAEAGATYVSLFANRMLDSNILELSGNQLGETLNKKDWKQILNLEKEKYFNPAWDKTLKDISYVATYLDNHNSNLIVGSIRSPEDILKLVKAKPQVITIPTKIVKGLENVQDLKETPRSIFGIISKQDETLFHPMTQYTIEEFEESAKAYKKI